MATARVHYPAFFRLRVDPAADGRRLHEGWPVLAPRVRAKKLGAENALQELGRVARRECEEDATLPWRLSAIPADATPGTATITVPWLRRRMDIETPVLRFQLGAHPIVCLPRLRDAVLVLPARTPPALLNTRLQDAVDAWFRDTDLDEPYDAHDEPEGVETWAAQRGDRFLWLGTTVRVERPGFGKPDLASLLQALSGMRPIDGAVELGKVAHPLADRYPDGLRLDLVPDPRVEPLRRLLYEDDKPAPTVLVGPSGAGKTTLVEAATRRYLDARAPDGPAPRDLHHLDPNRVIAGMSTVGAWERRMTAILERLVSPRPGEQRGGLYVDNPVALSLVGRSAGSALNLCSLLRPWLAERRLPFLLEATPEEWNRLEEADRAFTELFTIVRVEAPARPVALRMVLANIERIERTHACRIPLGSVRRLLELDERYPGPRRAPGSLVDRLDALASRGASAPDGAAELTPAQVEAAFTGVTGLNAELFDADRPLLPADLTDRITARLVGQAEAVGALADVVHVLRAGLARPGKPLATWLLVGPTGVGKTEAAKVLAELLYPGRERLLRFDMNELVDADAVHRLLGDETREGQLTGRVRQDPYAVVLLDEIEKAHPSVHDLLLQLLDEGRLTDARGRRADFTRAVVILTSNVGSGQKVSATGFGGQRLAGGSADTGSLNASYRAAVERAFRPELVNRLDRILVFQPLGLAEIRRIARLQIERVLLREGFLRRTVLLEVDDTALDRLAVAGFDPDLGARALKRTIERDVVGRLAALLATIPVEAPVVVRIRPVAAAAAPGVTAPAAPAPGVTADASVLHFATLEPARPVPSPLGPEEINTLLDRLPATAFRATASREGVVIEGRDVHELRDLLQESLRAFAEQAYAVELDNRALSRLRGSRQRSRGRERRWEELMSFNTVRAFLLAEAPDDELLVTPDSSHDLLVRLLERKLSAAGPPDAVRLRIRPVTRVPAAFRGHVHHWASTLAQTIDLVWADREAFERHPERGWERSDSRTGPVVPRIWRVRGPLVRALLATEAGLHVWYPPDAPPFALAVELLDDGPAEDLPLPPEPPIVRLLVPGPTVDDPVRIEDLRLGRSVDEHGDTATATTLRWWWMRQGG